MYQSINYLNTSINFTDSGSGKCVVLLHGYLESIEIWGEFASELAKKYRIISIDLLGHGQTGCIAAIHTMEMMADAVKAVLDSLSVQKCVMLGHSMGGYVALAFLEKYESYLSAFSLFHSSPFADTDVKRQNRDREIVLVRDGKKSLIYNVHCSNAFANQNVERLESEIEKAKQIAQNTPDAGIIAALEGMKTRAERSIVLKNMQLPFLYIIGKHDNFIPYEILTKIQFPEKTKTLTLENSGHYGFIEEMEIAVNEVIKFIGD